MYVVLSFPLDTFYNPTVSEIIFKSDFFLSQKTQVLQFYLKVLFQLAVIIMNIFNIARYLKYNSFRLIFQSGPGCSKLTMSLVNVSLNFQKLIS